MPFFSLDPLYNIDNKINIKNSLVPSLVLLPLHKEEGSDDTIICEPVTEECNGWGHVLACKHLHVGNHGSSIYVTLVAVDLSSKRSYMRHQLSGKAASSVHLQFACYFVQL